MPVKFDLEESGHTVTWTDPELSVSDLGVLGICPKLSGMSTPPAWAWDVRQLRSYMIGRVC
eukprot:7267469-Alexandrium_andersonii.AAC.1